MTRLGRRDFDAMLEFLKGLYATRSFGAYAVHVTRGLPQLIPSEICSYNEVNLRRRRVHWVVEPIDRDFPDSQAIFLTHMHEQPILEYWHGGAKHEPVHRAVMFSDFVSQREWHDCGIYTEFYRRVGVEHSMAIRVAAPGLPGTIVAPSLLRSHRDFSERDRLVLSLLGPHLANAYDNAEATTDREHELALLRAGYEALGRALIMLGPDRRIRQMTDRAQSWLMRYFSARWIDRMRLPARLDDWVRAQEMSAAAAAVPSPARRPLTAERNGRRLTLRLLSESNRLFVLLTQEKLGIEPGDFASLDLSRRESEVLAWVAAGKTNEAIAATLGLSPVTVKHTLERIYVKLGVGTRAAAVAIAMRAAGRAD